MISVIYDHLVKDHQRQLLAEARDHRTAKRARSYRADRRCHDSGRV